MSYSWNQLDNLLLYRGILRDPLVQLLRSEAAAADPTRRRGAFPLRPDRRPRPMHRDQSGGSGRNRKDDEGFAAPTRHWRHKSGT